MPDHQTVPNVMAVHSFRKALSYLLFSIFALIASIGMTILFTTDLSAFFHIQLLQNEGQMNRFLAIIFGSVLLISSLLSIHMAWKNFQIAHKLEKEGQLTDGIVTNKWVDTFERRVLYHVSYRFQNDIEAWEMISKKLYHKLSKGCNVPVRYLKENPSVSRLDHDRISA